MNLVHCDMGCAGNVGLNTDVMVIKPRVLELQVSSVVLEVCTRQSSSLNYEEKLMLLKNSRTVNGEREY